jgi:hypothetical protein
VIRFHLDEHVHHAIARALLSRGIDVTTSTDAGLLGAEDDAHIAFANSGGRVIVTNDADFMRLADQGMAHHGIVYYPRGARSIGDVVRHLCLMHDGLEPDEMIGKVEYL